MNVYVYVHTLPSFLPSFFPPPFFAPSLLFFFSLPPFPLPPFPYSSPSSLTSSFFLTPSLHSPYSHHRMLAQYSPSLSSPSPPPLSSLSPPLTQHLIDVDSPSLQSLSAVAVCGTRVVSHAVH
jgi:hypothetical protein